MRQRVAILRAFLANAPVLLMDEPFGALDAQTKLMMQTDLLQLWNQSKTVVYVTHDIEEAILLADRILVMSGRPGKISAEIAVHFSRPRDLDLRQSPTFAQIFQVELINARNGLGLVIWRDWETLRVDEMYATLIAIAMIGGTLNKALHMLTTLLTPWHASKTDLS
jgi:ABC-type Fe3+/spermidine/putrescine transport system ATPase subunit